MVASIGEVAAPSQGASYYERDGYYAKDSPEHLAASAWAGKGAAEFGIRRAGASASCRSRSSTVWAASSPSSKPRARSRRARPGRCAC